MTQTIHTIYTSVIAPSFSEKELEPLLQMAREKNERLGLSGMLLYSERSFFQVLEGPDETVDSLFQKIASDSRHMRVTRIIREPISKKYFDDWTMGFSKVTNGDLQTMPGVNDFFQQGASLASIDPGRAKKLLTAFQKGRWRLSLSGAQQSA